MLAMYFLYMNIHIYEYMHVCCMYTYVYMCVVCVLYVCMYGHEYLLLNHKEPRKGITAINSARCILEGVCGLYHEILI